MAAINLLLSPPTIVTALLSFFARVLLPHWIIFNGVWWKLIIKELGITFSTFKIISYRKGYSISFWADSGKSPLVEVFWQRKDPIVRNKLWAQKEDSKFMSPTTFGYFLISALRVALLMDQVITTPQLLIPSMNFWTIESNFLKSKGCPVFKRYVSNDESCWRFLFFASWSCLSYLFYNSLKVPSLMFWKCFWKLCTAVVFRCSEAYSLMEYRFSLVHL